MIWILNGKTLAKKSEIISYDFKKKEFSLNFTIPNSSSSIKEYDFDELRLEMYESSVIKELKKNKYLIDYRIDNGSYFNFEFSKAIGLMTPRYYKFSYI